MAWRNGGGIRLRCANAEFGTYYGPEGGRVELICRATRCKDPDGVTVHIFNCKDGTYENRVDPFRDPHELRGLPGVKETRHGAHTG